MARLRFLAVAVLALVLAGSPTQTGRSADDLPAQSGGTYAGGRTDSSLGVLSAKVSATDDGPCVIYALADMGYDSDLGKWIAQTIPEMIESKSWQEYGGTGMLRYYAPKNILIIRHSAAIQGKVEGFLKDLKKSLPKGSDSSFAVGKKSPRPSVVPAEYRAPALLRTSSPVPEASSYPVPAPVKPPKHLFHFLIRYEGEGIIDNNVVKFLKAYNESEPETARRGSYAGGSTENPPVVIKSSDTEKKEDKKDDKDDKSGSEPQP